MFQNKRKIKSPFWSLVKCQESNSMVCVFYICEYLGLCSHCHFEKNFHNYILWELWDFYGDEDSSVILQHRCMTSRRRKPRLESN